MDYSIEQITTRIKGMKSAVEYFISKDKGIAKAQNQAYLQALKDIEKVILDARSKQ